MERPIWSQESVSRRSFYRTALVICLGLATMYKFVPDARPYFLALLDHTVTLLAGCGATVLLGILQKYAFKKPLSIKWEVTLLAAFVFFAGFQAWKDERKVAQECAVQLTETHGKLDELTKPNLVLTVVQLVVGDNDAGLKMFVEFAIKNLGAPSAASAFDVQIKSDISDTGRIRNLFIPEGDKMMSSDTQTVLEFHRNMSLDDKTAHAVQRGDLVGGWLKFFIPGWTVKRLHQEHASITFYFLDINDKEYHITEDKFPSQLPKYSPATGSTPFVFKPEKPRKQVNR
jgi:hypothetical protein